MYSLLKKAGIETPRNAILRRDENGTVIGPDLIETEDSVQIGDTVFHKPFVEKPLDAEDHSVFIYYPTSAGGGSQRLFRKIGSRSSVYSRQSCVRRTGSYIYEDFVPTDGTDVKVDIWLFVHRCSYNYGILFNIAMIIEIYRTDNTYEFVCFLGVRFTINYISYKILTSSIYTSIQCSRKICLLVFWFHILRLAAN